jgi:hypothetical protein
MPLGINSTTMMYFVAFNNACHQSSEHITPYPGISDTLLLARNSASAAIENGHKQSG